MRLPPHSWQTPAAQVLVGSHAVPQVPQLRGSVAVLVQMPAQAVCVPGQTRQLPFWQATPAPQTLPQDPQFAGSEAVSVHSVPQAVSPVPQEVQLLIVQTPLGQMVPQVAQL